MCASGQTSQRRLLDGIGELVLDEEELLPVATGAHLAVVSKAWDALLAVVPAGDVAVLELNHLAHGAELLRVVLHHALEALEDGHVLF